MYVYRHFDCFIIRVDGYPIRNLHEIVPRFQRLSMLQKSIYYIGPQLWNSLYLIY